MSPIQIVGPRPPSLLGRDVIEALTKAGVLAAGDRVTRVVIDARLDSIAVIHVQRNADERLLDVLPTLDGIELAEMHSRAAEVPAVSHDALRLADELREQRLAAAMVIPVLILATDRREAERIAHWHTLTRGQWAFIATPEDVNKLNGLDRPKVLAAPCWPLRWGWEESDHLRDLLITRRAEVTEVSCTRHTKAEVEAMLAATEG